MNTYHNLKQELVETIKLLEVKEEVLEPLGKYFDEEINDEDIFPMLNKINLGWKYRDEREKIEACIEKLSKSEYTNLYYRYMRAIFYMAEKTGFNLKVNAVIDRDGETVFKTFTKMKIPFRYFIVSEIEKYTEFSNLNRASEKQLRKLYSISKKDFRDIFENIENRKLKLCLAIILLMEKDETIENNKLKVFIEKTYLLTIEAFIGEFNVTNEGRHEIINYINGCDEAFKDGVGALQNKRDQLGSYIFTSNNEYEGIVKFLYFSKDVIELNKRTLKLIIMSRKYKLVDELLEYIEDETIKNECLLSSLDAMIQDLEIPREYYVDWLGQKYINNNRKKYAEFILKVFNEDKECLKRAALLTEDVVKTYLYTYFLNDNDKEKYIERLENCAIDKIKMLFRTKQITEDELEDLELYLKGKINLTDIVFPENFNEEGENFFYADKNYILEFIWLKEYSSILERIFKYVFTLRDQGALELILNTYCDWGLSGIHYDNFKSDGYFVELVNEVDLTNMKEIVPFITQTTSSGHNWETRGMAKEIFDDLVVKTPNDFIAYSNLCNSIGKEYLLNELTKKYKNQKDQKLNLNEEEYYLFLLMHLGDGTKCVKETVLKILQDNPGCKNLAMPLMNDKKANVREGIVKFFIDIGDKIDPKELIGKFKERLKVEKSSKVKNLIMEFLELQGEEESEVEEDITIDDYCKNNLNKRKKKKVEWLELGTLPALRLKDSKEVVNEEVLYYLLITFADNSEIKLNHEGKKVAKYLDESSLNDLAIEILNRWIEEYADTKQKWVLSLAAMFGDSRVVDILSAEVKSWSGEGRSGIACQAIKALALQGGSQALMIVDNISRKFKNRKVKNAAGEAIEFAAKELEIDVEELADRIVPTLGFDEKSERIFNYGNRKFIVVVTKEINIEVYKEDGKILKNLPAVGKNDNKEIATKASQEFKLLKKQLKTVVTLQTQRLENVLSINRKWTVEKWKKLFVDNVIMHRFAEGLIWGVYTQEKLIQSFRYMEDGTFNTVDEEEYIIETNASIGLVHPLELSEEKLEQWKEQIKDYEIIQPVEQLERKIFVISEKEKEAKAVERFSGTIVDEYTIKKLENWGWNKGDVVDAGGYYEFYKEDFKLGLIVEINHSGLYAGGYMGEDVTIGDTMFYKIKEGSGENYLYSKLKLKDVPQRFLSEVMYEVYKITLNNKGIDEKYKK